MGNFTSIADQVTIILGGNHHPEWVSTYPFRMHWNLPDKFKDDQPASRGDVEIGSDVWIAHGVTILSGVKIGDGAVIGAGTLLTKDVPAYAIMGGVPAKLIKYRFSKNAIEELLGIKWWDWMDDDIKPVVHLLCDDRLDDFIRFALLKK
jgi:chloramphenicol O-acetyltransferase type B